MTKPASFVVLFLLSCFPAASRGEVIERFDSVNNITTGSDGLVKIDAFITTAPASAPYIHGVQINYDLTNSSGSSVYIEKKYAGSNLTDGDALGFEYAGDGSSNSIEFKVTDANGATWFKKLVGVTNTGDVWNTYILPLSALDAWVSGSAALDLSNITKYEFAVSKNDGGAGRAALRNLRLLKKSAATDILSNDCNSGFDAVANAPFKWPPDAETPDRLVYTVDSGTPSPKGDNYYAMQYAFASPSQTNGALVLSNILKTISSNIVVSSMDVTSAGYISFYLRGESGGERMKLGLDSWDGTVSTNIVRASVNLWSYKAITTNWQLYSIPLSDFTGLVKQYVVEQKFEFAQGAGANAIPGTGKVYVDDIRFTAAATPETLETRNEVRVIDDMKGISGPISSWGFTQDNNTDVSWIDGSGVFKDTVLADYSFAKGGLWIAMYRGAGANILKTSKGLRFKYAGTGAANNLEFKIIDTNKTAYVRRFYGITNTFGAWKTITIPLKEFSPVNTASSASIDVRSIGSFNFTVSRNMGGTGGFCVADLERIDDPDFQANPNGFAVLEYFKIPDNPISPNGDGSKDKAKFTYALKNSAAIRLEVFNLDGSMAYSYDKDDTADGAEHEVEWAAVDKDNSRVNNGLYLYKFTAKDYDGQEDKIIHVIGVIR